MRRTIWMALLLAVGSTAWTKQAAEPNQPTTKPAKPEKATRKVLPGPVEVANKALAGGFEPLLEPLGNSGIDWTEGTLYAKGRGEAVSNKAQDVAMAKRAARLDAARNALAVMSGIRIDARGRHARIREGSVSVEGVLKRFKEVSVQYDPRSKRAMVALEASLHGANGVLKMIGAEIKPVGGMAWESPSEGLLAGQAADVVIIDARDIDFAPSLAPRIVTDSGQRIFGPADVPSAQRAERGLARYVYMKQTGVSRRARSWIAAPIARARVVTAQAGRVDPVLRKQAYKAFRSPLILVGDATLSNSRGTIVLPNGVLRELAIRGEARKLMRDGKLLIVTENAIAPPTVRSSR